MVVVAVGVIKSADKVYLTYRHANQHQGEKWEFPGGKVESGETIEQALKRELYEEVGIEVLSCSKLTTVEFNYSDKAVRLETYIIDSYNNEPHPKESQEGKWFDILSLHAADFPEANASIIAKLKQL